MRSRMYTREYVTDICVFCKFPARLIVILKTGGNTKRFNRGNDPLILIISVVFPAAAPRDARRKNETAPI